MARRKNTVVRFLRVEKDDSAKAIYAKARKTFSAADLAKFADDEKGIPARKLLAELEAMVNRIDRKPNRTPTAARAK